MTERFVRSLRVELPFPGETVVEARTRLADRFPRTALRRMTHLGLLVGAALDGMALELNDAVVYASTFAEARALEDYLLSFPLASPSLFQTSIHPSAPQQVLIGRQQPICRLWPHAGGPRLVEQALLTLMVEPAARVALVGGEEQGTWLAEHNAASPVSFAFAAMTTREASGALCRVAFTPAPGADRACPSLEEFARSLSERRALSWQGAGGSWAVEWP